MSTHAEKLVTIVFDVGGTGLKAILLDAQAKPLGKRKRVPTPSPATPDAVLEVLCEFARTMGHFDRVSVGFPGVVKRGATLTAHNLDPAWVGFELERVLSHRLRKPVRVLNDAAVQGYGAIEGHGVELIVTLGTGFGSALFHDGALASGLELGHHPWRKGRTYEEELGKHGLAKHGKKRWNKLLARALEQVTALFNQDHLFLGGGNAKHVSFALPTHVTRVPNEDGLLGGVALWRG